MSKYAEDDWTGEYINENKSIYLVNGEIVNKDNLSEETVTYYYDDDGNEFKEDEEIPQGLYVLIFHHKENYISRYLLHRYLFHFYLAIL